MELFKLYKHVNNTDVVMCPVSKRWRKIEGEVYIFLNVIWFNIVQCRVSGKEPEVIGREDNVKFKAKELKNWKPWGSLPSYLHDAGIAQSG